MSKQKFVQYKVGIGHKKDLMREKRTLEENEALFDKVNELLIMRNQAEKIIKFVDTEIQLLCETLNLVGLSNLKAFLKNKTGKVIEDV